MYLFITSTTYGTWLPGDERGFVSRVNGEILNEYGKDIHADVGWLKRYSQQKLKGDPLYLTADHVNILYEQFQETAAFLHGQMIGLAMMPNHFHLLVELSDDVSPEKVSGLFKSYGSRRLSAVFGKPSSGTWWTTGSSLRRKSADSIPDVVRYIKNQHGALLIWINPRFDVQ